MIPAATRTSSLAAGCGGNSIVTSLLTMARRPGVEAQWAPWGKDDDESAYRVLRCSTSTFGLEDFHGLSARYASGVKGRLSQYKVCRIPADEKDDHGYLAVGIMSWPTATPPLRRAGPDRGGPRDRVHRLFCVRYDDLAAAGCG